MVKRISLRPRILSIAACLTLSAGALIPAPAGAQGLVIDPFPAANPAQKTLSEPPPITETKRIDPVPQVTASSVFPGGTPDLPPPQDIAPAVGHPVALTQSEPLWRAQAGQSLRANLEQWAARERIKLVWALPGDYRVTDSISLTGSFETALVTLLDQYKPFANRPVADLHINPADEVRTLIVRNLF